MKIHRSTGFIHIDFSGAEAAWFLEELETVRGGAKFPKLRQVCFELRTALALGAPTDRRRGRPKAEEKLSLLPEDPPCEDSSSTSSDS